MPKQALPLIYLVDDEPMVLELAELVLLPLGYAIETFRDGSLAIESFQASGQKPDVVVSDYAMQTMNGLTLMDQCRRIRPGQKFLLMSGTVTEEVFKGRASVPDAFIAKPFDVGEFAVLVGKLVS